MDPIEISWGQVKGDGIGNQWFVGCRVNELFRKHRDKIWRCKPLIEIIVGRCRLIYQSLSWNLSWMEVYFTENGPGIDVDGDRCGIFPMGGGMGDYIDHNVDTADQAFCLYLCIRAAMDEVENALRAWERGEPALGSVPTNRSEFRFTKDLTKWGLFRVQVINYEEPVLNHEKFIWAKGAIEAEDIAERQEDLFDSTTFVDEVRDGPPMILLHTDPIVQEPEE